MKYINIFLFVLICMYYFSCSSSKKDVHNVPPETNKAKGTIQINNKKSDFITKSNEEVIVDNKGVTVDIHVEAINLPYKNISMYYPHNLKTGKYFYKSKGKQGLYGIKRKKKFLYPFSCGLTLGKNHPSPLDGYKLGNGTVEVTERRDNIYNIKNINVTGNLLASLISSLAEGKNKTSMKLDIEVSTLKKPALKK